jgi:thioredoxin 1
MAVTKTMLTAFVLADLALIGAAVWWFTRQPRPTPAAASAPAAASRAIGSVAAFAAAVAAATPTVLVDFNSEACPPCKLLSPILEAYAREHSGTVTVLSVDVVQVPDLARRFQSDDLPLVVRLDQGKETARFTGLKTAAELATWMAAASSP